MGPVFEYLSALSLSGSCLCATDAMGLAWQSMVVQWHLSMLLSPSFSTSSTVWVLSAAPPLFRDPLCLFIQYHKDCFHCLSHTDYWDFFHHYYWRQRSCSWWTSPWAGEPHISFSEGRFSAGENSIPQTGPVGIWLPPPLLTSAHPLPPNPHWCAQEPQERHSLDFTAQALFTKSGLDIAYLTCLYLPISVIPISSWLAICRATLSKFLAICPFGNAFKEGFFPESFRCSLFSKEDCFLRILKSIHFLI